MKNFRKSGHGRSQGVPKFFGALRGHLCDSTAFLYVLDICVAVVLFM